MDTCDTIRLSRRRSSSPLKGVLSTSHTAAQHLRDEAHLGQQIAGAVDNLRLPGEAIHALNEAIQLDDARHSVKVAQFVCHTVRPLHDRYTIYGTTYLVVWVSQLRKSLVTIVLCTTHRYR